MAKGNVNEANEYRAERKERLAKQAKQRGKKAPTHEGGKKTIGKIVKIALCVVVCCGLLYAILNFFGVPQRLAKAITIDGKSYSMTEVGFYYVSAYNQQYQTAQYYDQYMGEGMGASMTKFDISVSPEKQTTTDEDGNEVPWDEQLLENAIDSMSDIKRRVTTAKQEGIELDEDDIAEVDETFDSYEDAVENTNYSLSRYLQLVFGKGMTKGMFRSILEEQKLAEKLDETKQESFGDAMTEEEVVSVYDDDNTEYDVIRLRLWEVELPEDDADSEETADTASEETSEEDDSALKLAAAQAEAQQIMDEIQATPSYDEETFKKVVLEHAETPEDFEEDGATTIEKASKSTIKSNISDEAVDWAYEKDGDGNYVRKTGDMNVFEASDGKGVYVVYAAGAPYRDETHYTSVRHILISYDAEATTGSAQPAEVPSAESASGDSEAIALDISDIADENADTESETEAAPKTREEAQSEAQSILDEYNKYVEEQNEGEPDEDYFAELADQYSDDTGSTASASGTQSTSGSTGGLIADMANDGSIVAEFEDWAFCEGEYAGETRKPGDVAIVETQFGFHIMYYVEQNEYAHWEDTIRNDTATTKFADWSAEYKTQFSDENIVRHDFFLSRAKKEALDLVNRMIENRS